jgi:NADH-quinone oxidoreductase subunit E
MRLTPAYLTSVATFYDMLETAPRPHHNDVFICTNISCSLLGADELFDAMLQAAGTDDTMHVRSFECLGACDIAPMASVNGEYVGPLELTDAQQIVDDLKAGRPVLPEKQIRYRRSVDPGVTQSEQAGEFGVPADTPQGDTAGLSAADAASDRPGPPAPLEYPSDEIEDAS